MHLTMCKFASTTLLASTHSPSAFMTPQSYQDIYGHRKAGQEPFLKSDFYTMGPESPEGIITARVTERHREIRKSLSHAFSAKALKAQEGIVAQYVELLVAQLKANGDTPQGLDMVCYERLPYR